MRNRVLFVVLATALAVAAQESKPTSKKSTPPPRSDDQAESSSKDTMVDLSPPKGDASAHPNGGSVADDVLELHPYNPMKAMKDVEVGDYHMRNKRYAAAISRYREALEYKPHDAIANFALAQALEKTGDLEGARESYEDYLKILPNGPHAAEVRKALDRISKPRKPGGK